MDRQLIDRILDGCATLVELERAHPFRCTAYRNAGRASQQFDGDLDAVLREGGLQSIRGVGNTTAEHVVEVAATGRLAFHNRPLETTPPGLKEMLRTPGFGANLITQVHDELQISSIAGLRAASLTGKL